MTMFDISDLTWIVGFIVVVTAVSLGSLQAFSKLVVRFVLFCQYSALIRHSIKQHFSTAPMKDTLRFTLWDYVFIALYANVMIGGLINLPISPVIIISLLLLELIIVLPVALPMYNLYMRKHKKK